MTTDSKPRFSFKWHTHPDMTKTVRVIDNVSGECVAVHTGKIQYLSKVLQRYKSNKTRTIR